jgi:hypothetical protein
MERGVSGPSSKTVDHIEVGLPFYRQFSTFRAILFVFSADPDAESITFGKVSFEIFVLCCNNGDLVASAWAFAFPTCTLSPTGIFADVLVFVQFNRGR